MQCGPTLEQTCEFCIMPSSIINITSEQKKASLNYFKSIKLLRHYYAPGKQFTNGSSTTEPKSPSKYLFLWSSLTNFAKAKNKLRSLGSLIVISNHQKTDSSNIFSKYGLEWCTWMHIYPIWFIRETFAWSLHCGRSFWLLRITTNLFISRRCALLWSLWLKKSINNTWWALLIPLS